MSPDCSMGRCDAVPCPDAPLMDHDARDVVIRPGACRDVRESSSVIHDCLKDA